MEAALAITVTCPACQHALSVKDEHAGKRGRCPRCQAIIPLPALATAGASPGQRDPAARNLSPHSPRAAAPRTAGATPAASPTGEQLRARVLAGFVGEVPPVPTSLLYRLGILLTALLMILLPLVYVGIIGLACLAVYWHLTQNYAMVGAVRGKGAFLALIAYLAPIAVGGIMILFMIKPLFASPARDRRRRSVTPHSDPLLFEFVQRICQLVRAPMPRRIDIDGDINASASFRRGWLSMILGSDLVLTIGMPLAAGLSLQQFAGVLAHELGHFSQGTGMRLTYVIRTVNHWFVRVVYVRDSWDEWLSTAADGMDIRIGWVIYLARLGVWITRKILWGLMFLGHVVAGFMLRQMEFDADRYEARLAGSDTFEATCRRLRMLGLAWQGAQADLGQYYSEGRLVDNLPRLLMSNMNQLPAQARKFIDEQIGKSESNWLDSHPADKDRIASARAESAPGAFRSDLPATVLFENFDAAAKNVTWDFYCAVFGRTIDPKTLNPTEDLLVRQEQEQVADKARERFFAGGFTILRPVRLPAMHAAPGQNTAVWQQELSAARQAISAGAPAYCTATEHCDRADTRLVQARQARSVLASGVRLMRDKFENPPVSAADASHQRDRSLAELNRLSSALEPFEEAVGRRLRAGLMMLADPAVAQRLPAAPQMFREAQRLLPIVSLVASNHGSVMELRSCNSVLVALLGHLDGNEREELLIREILDYSGRVREQTASLRSVFERVEYPFDHAGGAINTSQYLLKMIPQPEEVGAIYEAADQFLSNLVALYARALGRLCLMAEAVEAELGYRPLPQPAATA
jgi:Zn-dependent protease with chaperone function